MSIPDKVQVGKIVAAVGIKGEVKVYPYTDYPERFSELAGVYAGEKYVKITGSRVMKGMAVLKLEGVEDRNAAEALRDKILYIDKKDVRKLEEDEYFIFDLVGLKVVDEDGVYAGKVRDVIENPAHSIFEIEKETGDTFLLPFVSEFVVNVDIKNGIMTVKLIEGIC